MIPAGFDRQKTPPGEQEVFRLLSTAQGTDDWIVFHSLDIAEHQRRIEGELDFLIIVPTLGCVCLEVKSHRKATRTDGMWHLGSDAPTPRGPFKQVAEALHSIRADVARNPSLARIPFASAVAFTGVNFDASSVEWCDWQVVDRRALDLRPIREIVVGILGNARERITASMSGAWFDPTAGEPTNAQCQQLTELLRPRFEFYESPRARRGAREEELRRYTDEQMGALDQMTGNERVLFEGPAGTGKTMLATEAFRRSVNEGRRTALICFNRLLGFSLRATTGPPEATNWAGTLHSLLLELTGIEPPDGSASDFWQTELPDRASELLLGLGEAPYEAIVLDESQDLFRPSFLDVLDLLVVGGLASGSWRFFGDFTRQAIYGHPVNPQAELASRTDRFAAYRLSVNCRNTPRIASAVTLLTGAPEFKVLRPDNGVEPQTIYYRAIDDELTRLAGTLETLRREGYANDEIVLLSTRADGVANRVIAPWRDQIAPLDGQASGRVRSGTIHAYKGLESPAVVVTDVDRVGDEASDALLYVAMSRATDRLVLLAHQDTKATLLARMVGA